MTTRILLVDDHKIIRDVIRNHLESLADFEVVGEAGDGVTALRLVKQLHPDVVVMDIGMPDLNGIDAARRIKAEHESVRVIALSMHTDAHFVRGMLKAGASAYLVKDCAVQELEGAVRRVCAGEVYLSREITGVVVTDYVKQTTSDEGGAGLSEREREVLQRLAEGKSTKQIALGLHVSVKTVESHRQNIMKKLGIHNLPDLTRFAIREGLTSLEE